MNKIFMPWKLKCALISLWLAFFLISCNKSTNPDPITSGCRMNNSSGTLNELFCTYDENHNIIKVMYISPPNDTSWENYHYSGDHVAYMVRIFQGTLGDTIFYTYKSGKYVEVFQ